jgi:hypothetical protein
MTKESTCSISFKKKRNKKEITGHSAMKSYLEKNNLHYFTFSPNSKKAYESSNLPPSPRHVSGRYFQQPSELGLQRHQHGVNGGHSKSTHRQTNVKILSLYSLLP